MLYLGIIGFLLMIIVTYLAIKQKVTILFSFTIIPLIAALLVGSSLKQITSYVTKGISQTTPIALIMLFAVPYFMMLSDTGFFNEILRRILKHVRLNPISLIIITAIFAMITSLDGSITSVFLITVPLFYPFYKKFGVDPVIMLLLIGLSVPVAMLVPWGSALLMAGSLLPNINNAPMYLFKHLLPLQVILILLILLYAALLGIKSSNHIKKASNGEKRFNEKADVSEIKDDPELCRPKMFWPNLILTLLVFVALGTMTDTPVYLIFAVALVILAMINYHDTKKQTKLLKKYATSLFPVMPAILLSGVVVGIMENSGMMKAMVTILVSFIPHSLGSYIYIIIALLSTPLMFLFTHQTWTYMLLPVVASLMEVYGVPRDVVIMTLVISFGVLLSPVAAPQIFIGLDLTNGDVNLKKYIKYTFPRFFAFGILTVIIGLSLGIFR